MKNNQTAQLEPSNFTGSKITFEMVKKQIQDRWPDQAKEYDPHQNCFTYKEWAKRGFRVRKGEKSIRSITFISSKKDDDSEDAEEHKYSRPVFLFYKTQVDQI